MCTVLLPLGVNPIAVKYISYHIISDNISYVSYRVVSYIVSYISYIIYIISCHVIYHIYHIMSCHISYHIIRHWPGNFIFCAELAYHRAEHQEKQLKYSRIAAKLRISKRLVLVWRAIGWAFRERNIRAPSDVLHRTALFQCRGLFSWRRIYRVWTRYPHPHPSP